ncbi:MAG: RluA family pseudouridine synthase [Kiritimatiellia bacterium]
MDEKDQWYVVGEADAGVRLDVWLSRRAGLSRARVQSLIRSGAVVDAAGGRCLLPKAMVTPGAVYCVQVPEPAPAAPQPQAIALAIVYEDEDLVVLNKPAGLVVHPAVGHADGTLVNALLHHCKDLQGIGGTLRPGIVHRLDKDTSGLLVVAKHERALQHLAVQFHARTVRKVYQAITAGVPDRVSGRIETLIGRSRHDRKKMSTNPGAAGKSAVSCYKVLKTAGNFALIEVGIETGRTHQIRVHLAHIGCPIAGDRVYGAARVRLWNSAHPDLRQMLHAGSLAFRHPETGAELAFTAPMPADMHLFAQAVGLR